MEMLRQDWDSTIENLLLAPMQIPPLRDDYIYIHLANAEERRKLVQQFFKPGVNYWAAPQALLYMQRGADMSSVRTFFDNGTVCNPQSPSLKEVKPEERILLSAIIKDKKMLRDI